MKTYEIVNMSDAYTFRADDVRVAQAACLLLGSGQYALKDEDGEDVLPLLMFGADEWLDENFGGMDGLAEFMDNNMDKIADCLDTVMSFGIKHRKHYDKAIEGMDEEEREKYRLETHDENRSSLNNIGQYAWDLAEKMRARAKV